MHVTCLARISTGCYNYEEKYVEERAHKEEAYQLHREWQQQTQWKGKCSGKIIQKKLTNMNMMK